MFLRLALFLFCLVTLAPQGFAGEAKTFAVAPFTVHGPKTYTYLQQGIPSMLQTRLTWPGHFNPAAGEAVKKHAAAPITDKAAAHKVLKALKADYLVYGSVTIMGKECSLDVQLINAQGTATPFASQTTIDQLIPSLETTARTINAKVFKRPDEQSAKAEKTPKINQMNPHLIFNQSHAGEEAALNPQFKYEMASQNQSGRWRSQSLKHESRGMIVVDADNDGTNEIFIIDDHRVYAYKEKDRRLVPLDVFKGAPKNILLTINALDTNKDGFMEIFVSGVEGENQDVNSVVLTFKDKKFHLEKKRCKFFFNVVKMPPDYRPTLIGQKKGQKRLLERHIHELIPIAGEYREGKRLSLPVKANVFNHVYLPKGNDYNIIVAYNDHLLTYSSANKLLSATEEIYAASGVKLEDLEVVPGLRANRDKAHMRYYFLPTRLLPANLDKDKRHELIVSRPRSVASQFFGNFRNFSQGEIHALDWDGIGLNIIWKTRRIKGTLVDYAIADINNDGRNDLVVCVQTYPGATGLKAKRTIVVAYPLDQSQP